MRFLESKGNSKDFTRKYLEVQDYLIDLLKKDIHGVENCAKGILEVIIENKDSGCLETFLAVFARLNVLKYESILNIYHRLLFEDWHILFERIVSYIDLEENPSSLKYLYESMFQETSYFEVHPYQRKNCVHAIWSFECDEAKYFKETMFKELNRDIRQTALNCLLAEKKLLESETHTELINICKNKNIDLLYDYPKEDINIYDYYIFQPYKKYTENLKEPKVFLKESDARKWLTEFVKNTKVFADIFGVDEYVAFEDGKELISILDEFDFEAMFICDEDVTYYITIIKNDGIILQGRAISEFKNK